MREYIVTLKNFDDLEAFYEDMETPGGNLYIPDRNVDCLNRRPISLNTHYLLTDEEAEQIRKDPRVQYCTLTPEDLNLKLVPSWIQSSTSWNKSNSNNSNYKNWALLRCVEGAQRTNWGNDSTENQSGTINVPSEGRNVDVVIVDGLINPNHPEMAVNNDGTGGSRVVQYNWFQHRNPSGTYVYGNYTGTFAEANHNHGCHVAGIAAGNSQGWARSANIYNISPYGDDGNNLNYLEMYDLIRAWHNSKPINPATGRRNPTITNNSYSLSGYNDPISSITEVRHRGIVYTTGLTSGFLNSIGILNDGVTTSATPARYGPLEVDMQMAIDDGIIIVTAAGNSGFKIDIPGGIDYDNYYVYSGSYTRYYHRGSSPGSATNQICVGSIGNSSNDSKSYFSNCGPRIDVYAPGSAIMSSVNSGGVGDPRSQGVQYWIKKDWGTSMASPQVCGVLACLLETYPSMNQEQVIEYLIKNSKYNQIFDSNGNYDDSESLLDSANRYLYYYKERPSTGSTWPKLNYKLRPNNGRLFPRQRIRR